MSDPSCVAQIAIAGVPVSCRGGPVLAGLLAGLLVCSVPVLAAESSPGFGFQNRADAAKEMIVLAVQQGISSLPPTSSQSFSYEYDPQQDTYVRGERLGPTVLRSPQTMGTGHFSFRLATSYFDLSDTFGPIDYSVCVPMFCSPPPNQNLTRFGLEASAHVELVEMAVTYGLANRVELNLNLPIVVTEVTASDIYLSGQQGQLDFSPTSDGGIHELLDGKIDHLQHVEYHDLAVNFPGQTNAGVGRISIGSKALLYSGKWLRLSLAPEFFFPSPSEGQLAGSESAAILPRAIAGVTLAEPLKLYVDAGYDYDFDHDELRSFVWTTGLSFATAKTSVDIGVGGSQFNQGITWTPSVAPFRMPFPGTITAQGQNTLGTTFVNFLFGVKLRVAENAVLGGAVSAKVNDEGFRPDAIGTISLEVHR